MTERPIFEIAADIRAHWANPNYAAVPYLDAMSYLITPSDAYGHDSAKSIILYFLNNAKSFKGEDARRIKTELKKLNRPQ